MISRSKRKTPLGSFVLFMFAVSAAVVQSEEPSQETIDVIGFFGETTTLQCPSPGPNRRIVVWKDKVFNENQDYNVGYNSSDGLLKPMYADRGFSVDPKTYALSIKVIDNTEDISGLYICYSLFDNETVHTISYQFDIFSKPECLGNSTTLEGSQVNFTCDVKSSYVEEIVWAMNTTVKNETKQEVDIGKSKSTITFLATPELDGQKVECLINANSKISCSLDLRVKYKVRNMTLPQAAEPYHPGDLVSCKALGNPLPDVFMWVSGPASYAVNTSSKGEVSVQLTDNSLNQDVKVRCMAKNTVNGSETKVEGTRSIRVEENPLKKGSVIEDSSGSLLIIIIIIVIIVIFLVILAVIILRKKKSKNEQKKKQAEATLLKAEPRKDYNNDLV